MTIHRTLQAKPRPNGLKSDHYNCLEEILSTPKFLIYKFSDNGLLWKKKKKKPPENEEMSHSPESQRILKICLHLVFK